MKKSILFATMLASMIATTSCTNELVNSEQLTVNNEKATVKLTISGIDISTTPSLEGRGQLAGVGRGWAGVGSSRASLTANDKALTDLYILDYMDGKLVQVLHQQSSADDFAEPDLTLDYGTHTLKVIATRSTEPSLMDALGNDWFVTPNTLTAVTAVSYPTALTSAKTSDTFGAEKTVTVGIGTATAVSMTLDRLVSKLVLKPTDTFPADCSTIAVSLQEHTKFSWQTFDVMPAVANQRTSDVSSLAGSTGTVITYFLLAPADGSTTDITLTMNRQNGSPYATLTVPDVPIDRNKVTTISGQFYNHQQGVTFIVNDTWEEEGNDIIL